MFLPIFFFLYSVNRFLMIDANVVSLQKIFFTLASFSFLLKCLLHFIVCYNLWKPIIDKISIFALNMQTIIFNNFYGEEIFIAIMLQPYHRIVYMCLQEWTDWDGDMEIDIDMFAIVQRILNTYLNNDR